MNGEISTGALRCSTRRKTHAQKTPPSRLLSSLIFILSAAPLVASAQNRALDFDGINDRLELTSAKTTLNYGGNDFTIEMLVKTSRTGVRQGLVLNRFAPGGEGDRYFVGISTGGFFQAYINMGQDIAADMAFTGATTINDGSWHHLAIVRQGATITGYVDGVLDATDTQASPTRTGIDTNQSPSIGALFYPGNGSALSDFFSGQLDELRFWGDARTATEIATYASSSLLGTEDDLIIYYNFDQGVGGGDNTAITSIVAQDATHNAALIDFARTGSTSNFVTTTGLTLYTDPGLALDNLSRTLGDASPTMTATSNSGGAISYASADTDVATINSTTGVVTLVAAGTTTITATQAADAGYSAGSATATLTIKASNSLPTASGAPTSFTVIEDVESALNFAAMSISDADGDSLTLTLSITAGSFSAPEAGTGVTVSGSGLSISLAGTAAALNTDLDTAANIKFTPAANAFGSPYTTLTYTLNDGTIDGATGTVALNVTDVNDRPVLDISGAPKFTTRTEDVASSVNVGDSVASLVIDGSITDIDGAVKAIAVTEIDNTNGLWYYSSNNGSSWNAFSGASGILPLTSARLLDATLTGSSTNKLRFVPNANWSGTTTIKYRAWDKSSGTAGGVLDLTGTFVSGQEPFSSAEETATLTITAVNDAPSISTPTNLGAFTEDSEGDMRMSFVLLIDAEDDTLTFTATVDGGTIVSVNSGAAEGVTATKVSATVMTVTGKADNINTYLDQANYVKYLPPVNFNGNTLTLSFSVSDGSFTATDSESIRVNAVNDAPVLNVGATPYSAKINRDVGGATGFDSENNGFSILGPIRSGDITDIDGPYINAIAVTSVDNRYGRWQYSTSWIEHVRYVSYYPSGWTDFSSTTGAIVDLSTNSVLLRSELGRPYIRYVPNPATVGTATLTYRAWDGSAGGSTGNLANTSVNGGTTPYSAATDSFSLTTTADPEISNLEGDIARAIGGSAAYLDVNQDATLIDIDSTRLLRLDLQLLTGREMGDEFDIDTIGNVTVSGTVSGSSVLVDGVAIGTFNRSLPASSDITFSLNSDATPARVQALLRNLVFANSDASRIDYSLREIRTIFLDQDGNEVRIISYAREAAGDADGDVIAASGIDESASIVLPTSKNTLAEAVAVMDFTITDGGTSDGLPLEVTRIGVALSGTMNYSERITLKFVLDGPDVSNRVGSWGSGSSADAAIYFSSLPISVADGGSETYTLKVYADPTKKYTSGRTVITTVDGDDPFRWIARNTRSEMKISTTAVTNGTGFTVNAVPTKMTFTTMPADVDSGLTFTAVVAATDSGGSIDTSFTEDVMISVAAGAGSVGGTTTVTAVAGVATFNNINYVATSDHETFSLQANDEDGVGTDLAVGISADSDADVVADKLIFARQPLLPLTVSGVSSELSSTTSPVVAAVGPGDVIDLDYRSSAYNKSKHVFFTVEGSAGGTGNLSKPNEQYTPGGSEPSRSNYVQVENGETIAWGGSGSVYFTNDSSTPANTETFRIRASSGSLTSGLSDPLSSVVRELSATITAASGVAEPIPLSPTVTSSLLAVPIFDFTINDGGGVTSDGLPLTVTNIYILADGTLTDLERSQIRLKLSGPDITSLVRSYTSSRDRWEFSLSGVNALQVTDKGSEIYTISAYFGSGASIEEGKTLKLSVSMTANTRGTGFGSFTTVDTGAVGSMLSIDATGLAFTTQPSSSVSGNALTTQPAVSAIDSSGNIDTDFSETVTISKKTGDGTLAGTFTATAVAGVATFTDLVYSATADGEAFVLSADDAAVGSDLAAVDSASTSSDVVATKLTFSIEPAPLTVVSGQEQVMTTVPVVRAVDGDDLLDTDYTTAVTLSEVSGAGSALMSVTSDTDSSTATASRAAVAGEATFTGMALTYTTSAAADETFALRASSGGLTTADSATLTAAVPNSDGTLVAAAGVTESVALDSTVDTAAEAVNVFDFTLSDGGGDDGLGIAVSALNVQLGGTSTDALRAQVTWLLNGLGVVDAAGTYDAANDRLAFTGLGIDIASGASATYTLSAFYNDNTNLIDGSTFALSITGSSDLTLVGTSVASTTAVTATTPIQVVATGLRFTTLPAGTIAGAVFTTQPVVSAVDAFGNVDTDFTETVTLSESSAGAIDGDIDVAAVAGVATFSGLSHKPAADGETLAIVADDEGDLTVGTLTDLPSVTATAITSDVIATQLAFLDEPAPLNVVKARATPLTTVPRVGAVNADGIVDADRTGTIVLTLVDGAGTIAMSATGDTDGDPAGSETSITLPLTAGVASFTDMSLTYTNSGDANETFKLQASHPTAPSLSTATTVKSAEMRGVVADTDGGLSAAAGVTEPVAIPSTLTSAAAAVDVFDFVLSDGATVDSLPLLVNGLAINVSGTSSDAVRVQLSWLLNGPDASDVVGSYDAVTDKLTFAPLTLSIASGAQETYTVSAYYNDNSNLTDNQTLILSIDGDTDLTLDGSGTQFSTTTPVTNGTGSLLEVIATSLVFTTEPAGSASGSALTTQPVIAARDAAGNTDTDFAEAVTLTTTSGGKLSRTAGGAVSTTATAGVATFTDVIYTASTDKQAFTLIANDNDALDSDLPTKASASVSSEVTATELVIVTQPSPRYFYAASSIRLGWPIVAAVDSRGILDTDATASVVLTETAGAGSAVFDLAGDTDASDSSVTVAMVGGVASFDGVAVIYTRGSEAEPETFKLAFNAAGLSGALSDELNASPAPPPIDTDGTVVSAAGVIEPVNLDTTKDTIAEAVAVFDFTVADGGGADETGMRLTAITLPITGGDDTSRAKLTWLVQRANGAMFPMTYNAAADRLELREIDFEIAHGSSETFTLRAYYHDNTGLTEGTRFGLSLTGASDFTVTGTQISSRSPVTNGSGSVVTVEASMLVFTQQPEGEVAGVPLTTQPIVQARDAFGNVDRDFTEIITLTETGRGKLGGVTAVAAVAGTAVFTEVSHKPAVDVELLVIVADDEADLTVGTRTDLPSVSANSLRSDVIATKLVFIEEPAPLTVINTQLTALTTAPRVVAVNADGIIDRDYEAVVSLTGSAGAAALRLAGSEETTEVEVPIASGEATFSALSITYTNATAASETFTLNASSGELSTGVSAQMRSLVAGNQATMLAGLAVDEPVDLPSTALGEAAAVALMDFSLVDDPDSLPLLVEAIRVSVSGTAPKAVRERLWWVLNGPDASGVVGRYEAELEQVIFSPLAVSVADDEAETYTVSAYFTDNSQLTDHQTLLLSIDGDTDLGLGEGSSQIGETAPVTNGVDAQITVKATEYRFATQPAGSVSGAALLTQPVVWATDGAGNVDLDFEEAVVLSTASPGELSGPLGVTAEAGAAGFTDLVYTAVSDKETFVLTVSGTEPTESAERFTPVDSVPIVADVQATALQLTQQPGPIHLYSGWQTEVGTLEVRAVDAQGTLDSEAQGVIELSYAGGSGLAVLVGEGDTDSSSGSVTHVLVDGVGVFEGLELTYTLASERLIDTFTLEVTSDYGAVNSETLTVDRVINTRKNAEGRVLEDVVLGPAGELSGGELCGRIVNAGKLMNVTLCKDAEVVGGEVGESITGDPQGWGLLTGVTITPGTRLKAVLIAGVEAFLVRGVVKGESETGEIALPARLPLTDALVKITRPGGAQGGVDLRGTVGAGQPRTSSLELDGQTKGRAVQAPAERALVSMAYGFDEPGVVWFKPSAAGGSWRYFTDDNGYLCFAVRDGLEVIMTPMFADEQAIVARLERDYPHLELGYDQEFNVEITRKELTDAASKPHYLLRPGLITTASRQSVSAGFAVYPNPLLAQLSLVSFIHPNAEGELTEQTFTPVPKDWFGLKARLLSEPDVTSVKIDGLGLISVVYQNQVWQMMASYDITPNVLPPDPARTLSYANAGDLNGDGEIDYYLYYPNGDRQTMYIVPRN